MKNAILGFLVNRFAEHSSAVGIAAIVGGAWQLYTILSAAPIDANAAAGASTAVIFGIVAFVTKDGKIVDTLKSLGPKA